MIALIEKHVFKIHYTMWFAMFCYVFMAGALGAGYRDAVSRQAEISIMAQIPSDAYATLPLNLLAKVPVTK